MTKKTAVDPWHIKGELMLSCNCTVFCPCVLSLGQHPPTEGYCQTWAGIRIDEGHFGDTDLSGRRVGLMMEIPGLMSRGNWTVGLFVDDEASENQGEKIENIFSGKARGTSALLAILVGNYLGMERAPISYQTENHVRHFTIPKIIEGEIHPVRANNDDSQTKIVNSQYWIAPEIIVSEAKKSRFRAFGRNWNFQNRSAEICALDWSGP